MLFHSPCRPTFHKCEYIVLINGTIGVEPNGRFHCGKCLAEREENQRLVILGNRAGLLLYARIEAMSNSDGVLPVRQVK